MPREFKRADRVADAIQRALAQIIPKEIRDPRLGMVNVNAVEVNRDLANAKVYITLVGQEGPDESKASADILNRAASFLRSSLAKEMTMRSVPNLQFIYDASAIRGQNLSSLIERTIASDEASHKSDPSES